MPQKLLKSLVFIFALINVSFAQTTSDNEAFQGIKWGASVEEIKRRFPSSMEKQSAPNCEKDSFFKAKGISYTRLVVSNYVISDIPFTLSFYLSASDKTLREVGLYAEQPVASKEMEVQARSAAASKCKELQRLVSTKYGYSSDSVSDDGSRSMYLAFAYWLDGSSSTFVKLTCFSGTYLTHYLIEYTPKMPIDSQKL